MMEVEPEPNIIIPFDPTDNASVQRTFQMFGVACQTIAAASRVIDLMPGQPSDRATNWNVNLPIVSPPAANALPHYRLGSDVPDYWFPFFPVPGADSKSPVQLQRGRLPTAATRPLGRMLAGMLSMSLEEVPREGVLLERRYRLARGPDGSAYLWIGRRRSVGKGEGRSGLRFDFLE
ncbi:MAG: hypothetical protein ABSG32_26120 [Terriglobia bacterium]|jgi:hypothetical protein